MTRQGDDPLDMAAAHWARLQADDATPADRAAVEAWCAQSPDHRDAMERVKAGWADARLLHGDPAVSAMLADMRSRHEGARNGTGWRWRPALAAASLVALVAAPVGYWLMQRPAGDRAVAVAVQEEAPQEDGTRLFSPAGQRRDLRLPDGSRVLLDADSAIRFAFSDARRAVTLERGRAFFAVHKDLSRPFIVSADRLTATAVGTAFDVSLLSGRQQVTTSEGVVRVVTQGAGGGDRQASLLPAGMRLTRRDGRVAVGAVDVGRESAWRDGRILFSAQCLSDVAAQMNRYGARRLVVAEGAAHIAISGVFDLDNADGLAEALEQQGLVDVARKGSDIQLTRGGDAAEGECAGA